MFTSPLIKPQIKDANPTKSTWYPEVAVAEVIFIGVISRNTIMQEAVPKPRIPPIMPAKKPPVAIK